MAGDAGSPQSQPTDLSIKPGQRGSDTLKTDDYGNTDIRKSPFKFKSDMAAYYATFDKPFDLSNKSSVIKSTSQVGSEGAIRNAIKAITRSLTPTSAPSFSNDRTTSGRTASDEEVFLFSKAARNSSVVRNPMTTSQSTDVEITHHYFKNNAKCSSGEVETKCISNVSRVYADRTRYHPTRNTPSEARSGNPTDDKIQWRLPATDRPQYLDLRHVSDMSPDSGLGSATPIFGVSSRSVSGSTTSPDTPSGSAKFGKTRKRKLGPGRGWKFHDLSNDGGSDKKRVYAQNKLENGVLQRFREHVCVKSIATPDGSKDKLIVVEPSEVNDSNLIRCGTALRVILDKDAGTYKLQLLPYTLEEGPLSDQEKVLQAVSKMLGFNNEVLCPNAYKALTRAGSSAIIGETTEERGSLFLPPRLESLLDGKKTERGQSVSSLDPKSVKLLIPLDPKQAAKSSAHQRDALLWSLTNELKRYNSAVAGAAASGRKTCLMWHTPQVGLLPGKKKYIPVSKYCANCRNVSTQSGT